MPYDHRLLFHGFLLFLLGLGTGLVAYANWGIPLFSAMVGASQPILMGTGYEAALWQEALLTASPIVGVLPPFLCGALAVWGLRGGAHAAGDGR